MPRGKKPGEGQYSKDPEFRAKWDENVGQWADKEKASAAGKKGQQKSLEVRRRNKKMRQILENKQEFLMNSAAAAMEDNPEWMTNMIKMFMTIVQDESADPKDRMNAADKLTDILGTRAPKQQELKVEEKMSVEEANKIAQDHGLKVVNIDDANN